MVKQSQLPALTTEHLLFLIPLQYTMNKITHLSGHKIRIFLALKEYELVQEDEEGYGQITSRGNNLLRQLEEDMKDYLAAV